jgi:ABC-type bacteriocin/lantibiotic exporter with double-glycine peptidase domain
MLKENAKYILSKYVLNNRNFYFSTFVGLLSTIMELVITYLISNLLSPSVNISFSGFELMLDRKTIAALLVGLLTLKVCLTFFQQNILSKIQRNYHHTFSTSIYYKIISVVPIHEFYRRGPGYYLSMAGDESFKLSSALSNFISVISVIITLLCYIFFLLFYSFSGFLAFLAFCTFSFVFGSFLFGKLQRAGEEQVLLSRFANTKFADGTNNLKSIRCFNSEDYIVRTYGDNLRVYTNSLFRNDILMNTLRFIPTIGILLVFGALIFFSGIKQLESLILTALIFFRLLPISGNLYSLVLKLITDIKSINDLVILLKLSDGDAARDSQVKIESIDVNNVSYGFQDKTIVKNLSLKFRKGNVYAIKGKSGIGKSTLFDILLRFKTDFEGEITINGKDISIYREKQLRSSIHLIEQSAAVFNDTIENNILLGRKCEKSLLLNYISQCCLDEVFNETNLKGTIDFKGNNLSGGQKQRLSLLRGLIGNPAVMVLDETLTGLDHHTKKEVLHNLINLYRDGILIIITHDQEIMDASDEIIDFSQLNVT